VPNMIVSGVHCLAYHPVHAWVAGVVEDFDGKFGVINVTNPKKETITKVKEEDIFVCDEKAMDEDVNDLLNLSVLHDGTLLNCLRQRYMRDTVYTNIGAIVVALNPFNFKIPHYMDSKMPDYLAEGDTIQNNLPHSWAVAHNTYYEMRVDGGNQCILVSGESGAGKTEASKIVMKYLGAVSALRGKDEEKKAGQEVGLRMMQSNPILEAFGNAKTVRNDNSSRFGKLMKIKFNSKGFLTGADITKYLLEKSRIISSALDERVYHSFYLVLQGKDRENMGLQPLAAYKTVMSGKAPTVPGVDDGEDYKNVNEAMTICGVTDDQRKSIWNTLAGILCLQNTEFTEADDASAFDKATSHFVSETCRYWQISEDALRRELLTTTLVLKEGPVQTKLNKIKAIDARDSICKATYDNLFTWLVTTINKTIDSPDCDSWIALLDIFGFEDFKQNSFEQLCINLTNETLQGHYNSYIFTRDMEECRQEGIDTTEIKFPDNRPCIDMISAKGGILALLDEECLLGKGTDVSFLQKICSKFAPVEKKGGAAAAAVAAAAATAAGAAPPSFFELPKLAKVPSFRIVHYAGTVTYDVENFLEKNRDTLKDAFKVLMNLSQDPLVKTLLPMPNPESSVKFTVGGFFKNQLNQLMELINSTNPHWIRCVKPHPAKKPLHFDGPSTLVQLRSSGVLGTVQIRKAGFPIRIKIADFARKYKVVARGVDGVNFEDASSVSTGILKAAQFTSRLAQIGKTRVFLKSEAYQQLEVFKKQKLQVFANLAVAGALIALSRQTTAAFLQNRLAETVQAFLAARLSQKLFRIKDFESRKDVIIAQVKALLKLQKEEEYMREELAKSELQFRGGLKAKQQEALAALEAKWWEEKPVRDAKALKDLEAEESEARKEIDTEIEDGYADLRDEEACLEELARLDEERRRAEERARQLAEERAREEAERVEALRLREELKAKALFKWNEKMLEMERISRAQKSEESRKLKFVAEAAQVAQRAVDLQREELFLQVRERSAYPTPKFIATLNPQSSYSQYAIIAEKRRAELTRPTHHTDSPPPPGSSDRELRESAGSQSPNRPEYFGIGGLNPLWVNPAKEKARLQRERIIPDQACSLDLVQKLRRLQVVKDSTVVRTPVVKLIDKRDPLNPHSDDWEPPESDVLVLPDGSQVRLSDVKLPSKDEGVNRRTQRGKSRIGKF
jgi:myosin heavy subunit